MFQYISVHHILYVNTCRLVPYLNVIKVIGGVARCPLHMRKLTPHFQLSVNNFMNSGIKKIFRLKYPDKYLYLYIYIYKNIFSSHVKMVQNQMH